MTLYVAWGDERFRLSREGGEDEYLPVSALESAMTNLQTDWETWRVPWGEINRLQRRHSSGDESFSDELPSLPIAGAPGFAGAMFTFYARPSEGQKRRYGTSGNTYVAVIEFGPKVEARTLHTFGASADPASAHHFDQAPLYAEGDFKPAWLTLSDVQENAARSYHPGHDQK
jgi:acyl-homoserine lactone acylase PvdQ